MAKTENIHDLVHRVQHQVDEHSLEEIGKVILDVRDVQRLIYAAIWGDD